LPFGRSIRRLDAVFNVFDASSAADVFSATVSKLQIAPRRDALHGFGLSKPGDDINPFNFSNRLHLSLSHGSCLLLQDIYCVFVVF